MSFCSLCGAVGAEEDIEKHECNPPPKGKVKIDGVEVDVGKPPPE